MRHTTRTKPIPAPGRYKRPAAHRQVSANHVLRVDNLLFKFWTDNSHVYTFDGYVDVYALIPDQDGLFSEDSKVHIFGSSITSVDGETSMDIRTLAELIEALMTQSDIVGDHLYQTGHIEQVLAFEYVPEGQEWQVSHDIYLEMSADMQTQAPGWWVPRCMTCLGLHYEGDPHHNDDDYDKDDYDERELVSMCNYRLMPSAEGYQIGHVYYS